MAWFRSDRELAATKYAGRESASEQAVRKQSERGSLGRPHRNAREADQAGWDWADRKPRRRFSR
jgi:hypothetical protein